MELILPENYPAQRLGSERPVTIRTIRNFGRSQDTNDQVENMNPDESDNTVLFPLTQQSGADHDVCLIVHYRLDEPVYFLR